MKKKKFLTVVLAFVMALSLSVTTFAADLPQSEKPRTTEVQTEGTRPEEEGKTEDENSGQGNLDKDDTAENGVEEDDAEEAVSEEEQKLEQEKPKSRVRALTRSNVNVEETDWTAEDFNYEEVSYRLYGCDYSREFVVSGLAVSGFSETGLQKAETNKELVIPSKDPNGVQVMGVADSAFKNQGLTKLTLPEGVIVPYDDTVTHVVTERGNFIIGPNAFYGNNLTELTLPDGVIAVMTGAFSRNQLTTVSIPHTVWWLENSCFSYNNLSAVEFPTTTDFQCEIHAFAFSQNNIRSVRLPDYTLVVEKKAFYFNPGMTSVPENAPSGEEGYGGVVYMYTDNPNLANMERIHHIDRQSEAQLSWHQKLIIGDKPVEETGWTTDDFTYEGTTITGLSEAGLKKSRNDKELIFPDKTSEGKTVTKITGVYTAQGEAFQKVVLPGSVKEIGEGAFENCPITELALPAGLEKIGMRAFSGNRLKSLSIPGTLTVVAEDAFAQTEGTLSELLIGEGVKELKAGAFAGSVLERVNLPESLTKLDAGTFTRTAETKIKLYTNNEAHVSDKENFPDSEYHVIKVNLGEWNAEDFTYDESNPTIVTGLSAKGYLKRQDNRNLVIPDKNPDGDWITEIAAAVVNKGGLFGMAEPDSEEAVTYTYETVKLPSHLEVIGNYAFQGNGIRQVTFPDTLTSIGAMAFQTNDLEEIVLPDSITTLGNAVFATNPNTKRIMLSKSLTEIPASAFLNNAVSPYTELIIPDGVTKIGRMAFSGNSIKKLDIPGSVTEIGSSAFANGEGNTTLEELVLHEGLETIGGRAFQHSNIVSVELPTTVTKVDKNAFYGKLGDKVILYVQGIEQYDILSGTASSWHIVKINPGEWNAEDFTYDESNPTIVTGLSAQGYLKRQDNRNLVIPDKNPDGDWITEIAAAVVNKGGLFGMAEPDSEEAVTYTYETVKLPSHLKVIGNYAFQGNGIRQVTFPDTLTSIGAMAFQTNDLEEIVLPDSITKLGDAVFATNPNTKRIMLSKSLTEIPASAFLNNAVSPYTELIIPDGVTKIGRMAFSGNSIKKLDIPGSVTEIGSSAFANGEGNTTLEELVLHEGLETIGANAFKSSSLTSIDLPSTVTKLTNSTFTGNKYGNVIVWSGNKTAHEKFNSQKKNTFIVRFKEDEFTFDGAKLTGLTEAGITACQGQSVLVLPRTTTDGTTITEIADAAANSGGIFGSALSDGAGFEKVILPAALEKIGAWSFQANGIKEITFPETLKEIGQNAFRDNHIASVVLPESVTTLGAAAFLNNAEIEEIILSPNMKVIPASAFNVMSAEGAVNLTALVIPEGIEEIGNSAFGGNHIKDLSLPDSVVKIDTKAFMQNESGKSLETLKLSKNLEIINGYAFANSKLVYAVLPDTVTGLNRNAFNNGVNQVRLYTGNEQHLTETSKFKPVGSNHQVYYEALINEGWSMDDFTYDGETITGWSEKGHQTRKGNRSLVLPTVNPLTGEAITAIGDGAFAIPEDEWDQGHTGVESVNGMDTVVIPDSVTRIGGRAFQYNNLVKVKFPEGLVSIGANAFNSNKMEEVSLPDSVTEMKEGAFSANNITKIQLSKGLTKLESGVFSDNIRLSEVTIPNTITEIGDFAFSGDRLEKLNIPDSVTKIGRAAFKLHHLTELVIPGNVKEIGESAFEGTYKAITLKRLTLEEGVESIGALAFRMGYLETVILPDSLNSLDIIAFKDNTGKDNSKVVDLYTSNVEHMLFEASDYHQIIFKANWTSDCFTYDGTTITGLTEKGREYLAYTAEMILPDTNPEGEYITTVAAGAFKELGLTSVTLPNKLETIGEEAFAGNKLVNVTLPDTMKTIAANAFAENGQTVKLLVYGKDAFQNLKEIKFDGAVLVDKTSEEKPGGNVNHKADSESVKSKDGAVNTGDTSPVVPLTAATGISALIILAVFIKKKQIVK